MDAIVEPRVGGRWYERGEDGSTCQWGSVLSWEPALAPDTLLGHQRRLAIRPGFEEIEVRFIAEGEDSTRVELEHRKLDRYGARREEMRRIFETEGDWGRLLGMFAARAAGEASA